MKSIRSAAPVVFAVIIAAMPLATNAATIWIEGEDASSARVQRHPWWYDKVKTNELSGGAWISNYDKARTGEVSYAFTVQHATNYAFWLRANPTAAGLSWKLDGGEWQQVDFAETREHKNIAEDDHIDIRFIAWVSAGAVNLAAGEHTLTFMMHSANENHGAIDCIVLASDPFFPKGTTRPAADAPKIEVFSSNDSWAFVPPDDPFSDTSAFDLRGLNEKTAGETGFIKLSPDGNSFVKGDGTPIRFWSAVDGPGDKTPEEMDLHCRFIAKLGVNMVRIHGGLYNNKEGAKITDVNEKELDGIFRFVAACKSNGIYLTISPYWAPVAPNSWEIEGYGNQQLWGILFFNEKLQNAYKVWVKELYTRTNQYTGIPLKDDPAVAIIQVKNEDSLLFWTFQAVKEPQMKILRKKYGDWLKAKYGSLDKALAAWNGTNEAKDEPEAGGMGFLPMWELTSQAPRWGGGRQERLADQLEFLATLQRTFYADMGAYYQKTLGCKQIVNAMNWKSADQVTLDDVERWTYTANEVVAVNRYTGATHVGENNGYRVDPGHFYVNRPVVVNPTTLPCSLKQVAGHPFIITESSWVFPEEYAAEGPFLINAYMSLNGVDSQYWFALGQTTWVKDHRRMFWPVGDSHAAFKWSGDVPEQIGMFPANALSYRLGYIEAAKKPVVYEERSLSNMWLRTIPIISEEAKFDPNRDAGAFAKESSIKQDVDPLAFLVGPVIAKYGGSEANSYVAPDLDTYIDRSNQTVRSVTGQMNWDYGTGVCTINAPKYQGAAGFLKNGGCVYKLADVTIDSSNDYAAISVTALDDTPLAASRKVLVQVGTVVRPTGWTTREVMKKFDDRAMLAKEILDTGKPPFRAINTRATITIKNPKLTKATLLDVAGYPARPVTVQRSEENGTLSVKLPLNTMYLVIE
ncbi:hypothetical protein GX586_07915 [bacterium]|nr:hypothetical protein [bacterium]